MAEARILDRSAVAKILAATPNAITCRVVRRDWSSVPEPFRIGKKYYWLEKTVYSWLNEKAQKGLGGVGAPRKKKGRPRKTRSSS